MALWRSVRRFWSHAIAIRMLGRPKQELVWGQAPQPFELQNADVVDPPPPSFPVSLRGGEETEPDEKFKRTTATKFKRTTVMISRLGEGVGRAWGGARGGQGEGMGSPAGPDKR